MNDLRALTTAPATSNVTGEIKESPAQTAGPYVHIGCLPNWAGINGVYPQDLVDNQPQSQPLPEGNRINITGLIIEGGGTIAKDMMIESWQSPTQDTPGIWLRSGTHYETGEFTLNTIMPSFNGSNAPFVQLWIVARGINVGLHNRIYFSDHDHRADPVLKCVPKTRKHTLIAHNTPEYPRQYRFIVHLQGDNETVFFDL